MNPMSEIADKVRKIVVEHLGVEEAKVTTAPASRPRMRLTTVTTMPEAPIRAPEHRRRTGLRTVTFMPEAQTPARMGPDRSRLSYRPNSR